MKFEICEREDREYAVIDLNEGCLKNIKANLDNIKAFEDTNGTIDGNITPASNVKPTRK